MKRISQQDFAFELNRIVHSLRAYNPEKIILFGSFARGDYHAGSDVDLLIVKDTDVPFVERSGDVWRVCQTTLSLEPLVYTPTELENMRQQGNPLIAQVMKEGIVIYE